MPDAVHTVVCAPDDGWRYRPKHVEQFPDISKLCNVASCWIYVGILYMYVDLKRKKERKKEKRKLIACFPKVKLFSVFN